MVYGSFATVAQFLEIETIRYWLQRVLQCTAWTVFDKYSIVFYYRPNFYFFWSTLLSELTHMYCDSSEMLTDSLVQVFLLGTIYNFGQLLLPEVSKSIKTIQDQKNFFYLFHLFFSSLSLFISLFISHCDNQTIGNQRRYSLLNVRNTKE